jgi:hypothetical protein
MGQDYIFNSTEKRSKMRVKAVVGYDKNGQIAMLHTSKREADKYYERSANLTRIDFYSVHPDQLPHLSMALAMDIETKINSDKRRIKVGN